MSERIELMMDSTITHGLNYKLAMSLKTFSHNSFLRITLSNNDLMKLCVEYNVCIKYWCTVSDFMASNFQLRYF